MVLAAGCSTVIKAAGGEDPGYAAQRDALVEAAAGLAAAPWPKPSSSSLADRLAGAEADGASVSREDAVKAYVERLAGLDDAENALMADAARHLEAVGALRAAAEAAGDALSPRLSDVALIEDAIGDLRETRAIYVSALKKIDGDDDNVDALKRDFDRAIKELGAVADMLAENAMKRRAQAFARTRAAAIAN